MGRMSRTRSNFVVSKERDMSVSSVFKRLMAPLTGVLLLWSFTSAHADTFGRTTIGATPSGGLRADFKRGSKFTLSAPGTLRQLCTYIDGQGGGASSNHAQYFRLVVYRDASGVPGARVAETTYEQAMGQGGAARWVCGETYYTPLTPGDYWIVIHTGGGNGDLPNDGASIIRYYFDGTGNWYGNADTYADDASTTFGVGGAGDGTISAYAEFASGAILGTAGRATIASTPSSPMSADFKRGSSFTLSQEARVESISAYLDGLGATTGFQGINLVLYTDKNGVPDAYLAESPMVVEAGMTARWKSNQVVHPVTIPAGRYWVVAHTSGPPVARYYLDGTGNWYGNADTFSDGPSNPFGAGNTGNGTMSAFVSYTPGPFTHGKFGRTTTAAPLSGLSANYLRGSLFPVSHANAVVTGLNAYLDGLGGTTGSQKVKMAIYSEGWDLIEGSKEVIIPAGMSPQWVHFEINPASLPDPNYRLVIYTGNAAGVARSYGDGAANWAGYAAAYVSDPYVAPNLAEPTTTPGTVTLSVSADIQYPGN
jgi:hypothetical protein